MSTRTEHALGAVAVALLVACGASPLPAEPSTTAHAAEPEPERCGMVFSPDAELLDETVDAAARWSWTTGCDVRVGEGGVRLLLVADIDLDNGLDNPGWTHPDETGRQWVIELVADRSAAVLPHEMGHVLNPRPEHAVDEAALMHDYGGLGCITASDLEYVCEGLPCEAFAPEIC
jgi:hypothetical protein